MMPATVHLMTGKTPGLLNDADIVRDALRARYAVSINVLRKRNFHLPHKRLLLNLRKPFSARRDVMIFFENLSDSWMSVSDLSILIPNQEWMRPLTRDLIRKCRGIWCKTRYAEQLYLEQGFPAQYVGFTSQDMHLPEVTKDYSACLHIAGRSDLKGTATLLTVWARHPEWPTLKVVTRQQHWLRHSTHNIEVVTDYLDHASLKVLMNHSGIHLCPSETEGYGHYIGEALSTQALVVTTDAPPMNELVDPAFGYLAAYGRRAPAGYGERFFVDDQSLEDTLARALALPDEEKAQRGARARLSFLESKRLFEARFLGAVGTLS